MVLLWRSRSALAFLSAVALLASVPWLGPVDEGGAPRPLVRSAAAADAEDGEVAEGAEERQEEEEDDEGAETDGQQEEAIDEEAGIADVIEPMSEEQLRDLFGKMDGDKDGKVLVGDVLVYAEKMSKVVNPEEVKMIIEEMDSSKDGKVSLEEHLQDTRLAEREPGAQSDGADAEERLRLERAKFEAADVDGDQFLGGDEIAGLLIPGMNDKVLLLEVQQDLKKTDTDQDGRLNFKEWMGAFAMQQGFHDAEGLDEQEWADERKNMEMAFARLDEDKDEHLNANELKTWMSGKYHTEKSLVELFKAADQDHDSSVTADELVQAREKIAELEGHHHLMEWQSDHEL